MDLAQLTQQVATLTATNATLQASVTALTADKAQLSADLAAFSKSRREGEIKQLFSDVGRELKTDDPDVKAFSEMSQAGFDAMAGMLRTQFSKTPKAPTINADGATLFQHVAAQGKASPTEGDANAMANGGNPLLANAKARGEQFSKRAA